MNKVIAVATDIECTTLYDKLGGDVIDKSFVEILSDYTFGRKICIKSRPSSDLYYSDKSTNIHGISYWRAMEFQERCDAVDEAMDFLRPLVELGPLPLVYHANANFDHSWLSYHFMKEGHDDFFRTMFPAEITESTLKMARKYLKHIEDHKIWDRIKGKYYGPYSLPNVAAHYGETVDHHKSMSDALNAGKIWCNIKQKIDIYTGELDFD